MNNSATHSMFYVAALCTPEIDKKIQAYKLWMRDRFGCTVALKSPAHITLIPPFWMENEKETQLIETLSSFETGIDPFDIILKNFDHFSNRVLFVSVEENDQLGSLRKAVEDHFIKSFPEEIKPDDRPFHPHVTIANRDLKPGDFIKAWAHFEKLGFDETFDASNISLLKLSLGKWTMIGEQTFNSSEPHLKPGG